MKLLLAIGIGSFIGGIMRYLLSAFFQSKMSVAFPLGTFTVNIIGCFFIGLVFALADRGSFSPETKLIIATGLLGGFTTFSAFSIETVNLIRDGQIVHAGIYATLSVIVGVLATYTGILNVKLI